MATDKVTGIIRVDLKVQGRIRNQNIEYRCRSASGSIPRQAGTDVMSTKQEEFTNRTLAKLLKEQGLETDFEQRAGRKKMDVVAHVDGLRVVLEAETGFHRKSQAIKDADARLTQRLTTAVFAVCYPAGVTEENLRDANLTWTLRTRAGESVGAWSEGGIPQLPQAVQQTPGSLSGADVAAQQLSDALDVAVARLTPVGREALAKALDLPATKGVTSAGEQYRVAAKRGCWSSPPRCCFTTGCRPTCRLNVPTNTTGNGLQPVLRPARSKRR